MAGKGGNYADFKLFTILPYKKKMALVLDQIVNQFSNAIKKKKCAG
jgi:hypothetical protein